MESRKKRTKKLTQYFPPTYAFDQDGNKAFWLIYFKFHHDHQVLFAPVYLQFCNDNQILFI